MQIEDLNIPFIGIILIGFLVIVEFCMLLLKGLIDHRQKRFEDTILRHLSYNS